MSWIEKTRNGYRLCERVSIDGKTRRVTVQIDRNTPQAKKKGDILLREKIELLYHPETNMKLSELAEVYLKKKECKKTTLKTADVAIRRICGILGECKIESTVINRILMESGESARTINVYLRYFKAFLRWCYKYGYIPDDAASKIVKLDDKTPKKKSEEKYLEPEQLEYVLSQLSGMSYYVCKFLSLTGCRVGEALALNVDDIGTHVTINKTIEDGEITTPKTENSVREVYIQDELKEFLDEFLKWRKLRMMSLGVRTNILFFGQNGNHLTYGCINMALRKVKGIHVHSHMFRHSHVALLAEQGIPLDVISRRLGHSSTQLTRDIYYHVTSNQKKKDEEMLKGIRIV